MLLFAELRYNKEMLPKLQATKPELKTAISMTQIYLYNNDGTQYALLKSLYTDKDDNVVYTIEGSPNLQPVKKQAADAAVRKSVDSDGKPKAHCRYAQTQSVTKRP